MNFRPRIVEREQAFLTVWGLLVVCGVLAAGAIVWLSEQRQEDLRANQARLGALEEQIQHERSSELGRTLRTAAYGRDVTQAALELLAGYRAYIPSHLRDLYVELNPYKESDTALLIDPRDGSKYSRAHAEHHPFLSELARRNGLTDVFLIVPGGEVIYSSRKGAEFARRLDPRGEGGLDEVYRRSLPSLPVDALAFAQGYQDELGRGVMYASTPIVDENGKLIALLAVERYSWVSTGLVPSKLVARKAIERERARALGVVGAATLLLMILGFVALRGRRERGGSSREALPVPVSRRFNVPSLFPQLDRHEPEPDSLEHASGTRLIASKRPVSAPASVRETGTTGTSN